MLVRPNIILRLLNGCLVFEQRLRVDNEYLFCEYKKMIDASTRMPIYQASVKIYHIENDQDYLANEYPPCELQKAYFMFDGIENGKCHVKHLFLNSDIELKFIPELKLGFNMRQIIDESICNEFGDHPFLSQKYEPIPDLMFVPIDIEVI